MKEDIMIKGHVFGKIEYKNGDKKEFDFPNTILRKGRNSLASSLTNEVGDVFEFYISRMIFGDGGTVDGTVKHVNSERTGLFGVTRANKPVISQVDPNILSQAIFTSVISYSEANGYTLNEMALQMANGELYSMVTFPDLTKTDQMQITWNWRISAI